MSREGKKSGEFRRYRQALAGVYLACVAAAFALLAASVAKALLFAPPLSPRAEATLADCESSTLALLDGFEAETVRTIEENRGPEETQERWRQLARRAAALRARCLTHKGGSARDATLAEAFEALGDVERGYRDMIDQFEDEVVGPRERVRRALARVRPEGRENRPPGRAGGDTP